MCDVCEHTYAHIPYSGKFSEGFVFGNFECPEIFKSRNPKVNIQLYKLLGEICKFWQI